jgi:hypothetical protein
MNKTKRVAWHKRLKKRKKAEDKAKAARRGAALGASPQTSVRQATPRR